MVALELLIDASGMERGAQQATRALDTVSTRAQATERTVTSMGRGLNTAFQATGGSVQIAQGISQTATALGNLNLAAAGFGAARTALEVARTADDFRNLSITTTKFTTDIYGMRTAVQSTATGFAALRAVMVAHPILTVATAISAAAGLMTVLSSNTRDAASAFAELANGGRQIQSLGDVAKLFGSESLQRSADQRYVSSLHDTAAKIYETGQVPSLGDLQKIVGAGGRIGDLELFSLLQNAGNRDAGAYLYFGRSKYGPAYQEPQITRDQALEVLRESAIRNAPQEQDTFDWDMHRREWDARDRKDDIARREQAEADRFAKAREAMEQLNQEAQQFGNYLGNAFVDAATGAASLRQVLQAMALDFTRSIASSIFADIYKSAFGSGGIFGGGAGKTATQKSQDAGQGVVV